MRSCMIPTHLSAEGQRPPAVSVLKRDTTLGWSSKQD